jgi:hypothetical protein
MKSVRIILPVIVATILTLACQPEKGPAQRLAQGKKSADSATFGRYGIKSGILRARTLLPALGSIGETTIWFDDYGTLERNETVVNVQTGPNVFQTARYISIIKGDTLYNVFGDDGVVRRMSLSASESESARRLEFCRYGDSSLKAAGIVRRGTDTILGRSCDVFIVRDAKQKSTGTYHVWKCFPLQIDVQFKESRMQMTPISLEEGVECPPSMFAIPSGMRILDADN